MRKVSEAWKYWLPLWPIALLSSLGGFPIPSATGQKLLSSALWDENSAFHRREELWWFPPGGKETRGLVALKPSGLGDSRESERVLPFCPVRIWLLWGESLESFGEWTMEKVLCSAHGEDVGGWTGWLSRKPWLRCQEWLAKFKGDRAVPQSVFSYGNYLCSARKKGRRINTFINMQVKERFGF